MKNLVGSKLYRVFVGCSRVIINHHRVLHLIGAIKNGYMWKGKRIFWIIVSHIKNGLVRLVSYVKIVLMQLFISSLSKCTPAGSRIHYHGTGIP